MDISLCSAPDQLRLSIAGDIDMATADVLTRTSGRVLAEHPRRLVLDFSRVGFCDAAGIGAVARIYLACRGIGCDLVLTNLNPEVRRVVGLVGMDSVLTIRDGW